MFGHIALGSLAWWFFLRHESVTISEHIRLCSLVFGSYIISLFSSIVIYRLFFHRLRDFSGPRLAAVSKLWHIFKCGHGKNFRILEDTHRQYGQVVRTGKLSCFSDPVDLGFKESVLTTRSRLQGPNEITIFHPAAIETIEAPRNKTVHTDWYDVLHPRTSMLFTRDEAEHSARRRVWSQAMSTKCA